MRLITYSMSESGGMNGSYLSKYIAYTDDMSCKVEIVDKPFHNQPTKRVKYYADGLLEKLSEVCEKYNVISWTDLPEQQIFMHDAAAVSICFTFENGVKIGLGSGKRYPEHFHEMYQELEKLIRESENYGTDLAEVTEETPFMAMGMMMSSMGQSLCGQTPERQEKENTEWAKFCANCGAKFMENQKFCAECGSVRSKL